jgi:hypothetical protein
MWLEAITAGPSAGMCSSPDTATSHRINARVARANWTTVR